MLSQTYSNWEHIIVDGGSNDNTIDIIKSYKKAYAGRLRLFQGPDRGIYDAMNKGIAAANGIIIGIINSDDWYEIDAIEHIVEVYSTANESDLIITGGLNRIRNGKIIYTQMHDEITIKGLKKGMPLQHPAVFVTKSVYNRIGTFDISFSYIADYDFIWRCFADGKVKFLFVNSVVSNMREGGASDTLSCKRIWDRAAERYRLRSRYIPKVHAFISSLNFLIHELIFQTSKKFMSTEQIKLIYKAKKELKKAIKQIPHKLNRALLRFPKLRYFLVCTYHLGRHIVIGTIRRVRGYQIGFLTNGHLLTPYGENCFFGYYDKSPFSSDGEHYLFHLISGKRKPKVGERASICYASSAYEYTVVGDTLAWNLQQGAMLRFVNDELITWNDFDEKNKKYIGIFYYVKDGTKKIIDYPLYDITDDGKIGLSIDFERLNVDAEGYGYIQLQMNKFTEDTYIRRVNLETNNSDVIITLNDLCKAFPIPENSTFAYFNHIEFNHSGNRFIFILRYIIDTKRFSRLFSSNIDGSDIHLLADEELVSHCTWKDDNSIVLWCRYNGKNNYYIISDNGNNDTHILGANTPKEDGHPTFNSDRTLMVTDTYPDSAEYRHLIIYDVKEDCSKDIARLYAPAFLHGPLRCDFHPRWHPNMEQIIIDSVHEGFRGLYLVDKE